MKFLKSFEIYINPTYINFSQNKHKELSTTNVELT